MQDYNYYNNVSIAFVRARAYGCALVRPFALPVKVRELQSAGSAIRWQI